MLLPTCRWLVASCSFRDDFKIKEFYSLWDAGGSWYAVTSLRTTGTVLSADTNHLNAVKQSASDIHYLHLRKCFHQQCGYHFLCALSQVPSEHQNSGYRKYYEPVKCSSLYIWSLVIQENKRKLIDNIQNKFVGLL